MSISEQVKKLREYSNISLYTRESRARELLKEAADTIEALSARLQVANGSEWISCEDSKNIPYNKQLVWITIEYKGGDIERIEGIFIDGELCYMDGISVSTIAKAWMPRYVPEPYRPQPQRS